MAGDHSRQMKTQTCIVGDFSNEFRSLPILQIAGLQSPYDKQTWRLPRIWQTLGWSAKSKIPDRLGFFRHMTTRLKYRRQVLSIWAVFFFAVQIESMNYLCTLSG